MKLFEKLASFLRGNESLKDKVELSFETLSDLPVFLFAEEKAPFNQWEDRETDLTEEYRDFVKVCVWVYQFFTFYALIRNRHGKDAADATVNLQMLRLSNASPELGKQLKNGIHQIRSTVEGYIDKPHIVELPDQGEVELGVEYKLALEFLAISPGSPFQMTKEEFETQGIPDFGGLDFDLAICLAYGKSHALEVFKPMVAVANVTRWRD